MKKYFIPILFVVLGITIVSILNPASDSYSSGRLIFIFCISVVLFKVGEYVRIKIIKNSRCWKKP
jgi:hypothetical protein